MTDKCTECEMWASRHAKFCGNCGKCLIEKKTETDGYITHFLILIAVAIVVATVAINAYYCIVHFGEIYEACSHYSFSAFLTLGLLDLYLFEISGAAIAADLLFLIATGIACLVFGLYRFLPAFRKELETEEYGPTRKTGLSAAASYLSVTMFISIAYFLVAELFEQMPDASWMDDMAPEVLVFELTRAGIQEELMTRVALIGVPMAVVAMAANRDKRCWQYLFGGFGLTKVAFALIIVSSVVFGLRHYDGWGWSKVPDATVAGIIFGYLYAEYGLYAAILAHTANDVMSTIAYTALGEATEVCMMLALVTIGLIVLIQWIMHPRWDLVRVDRMETFPGKLECSLLEQWKR